MPHQKTLTALCLTAAVALLPVTSSAHWAYPGAMSKAEILDIIIGNSMTGKTTDGTAYTEYYAPDGVIHGVDSSNGAYEGRWSLRDDDAMCWAYAPDFAVVGCVLLVIDGDNVSFQLIDGSTEPAAKLLPGNPEGL